MSYSSTSIKRVITDIDANKVYLPALQRKFVWGKRQIQLLFDSLMRNYPIGAFLFWKLGKQHAGQYVFYEFLKEYDQRSPYNRRKTGAFLTDEIIGVLDGQQRLSSMYIGLMGTHTEKAPYKRYGRDESYDRTCLYLNLLALPYDVAADGTIQVRQEQNYEFRFLTEAAARRTSRQVGATEEPVYWLKVGDALAWVDEDPELDILIDGFVAECKDEKQKEAFTATRRLVRRCIDTLHRRLRDAKLLSYFEVGGDDLEDILKIFIRVNSGGTPLNKTDLLFSTIVATWDDGREKIESLQKAINNKGDKFEFSNEFLMRCCLVLTDSPVVYKVNSFRAENVVKIRDEWDRIAEAISRTVDLLVEFGFSGSLLTSQNATIIIAYYLLRGGDTSPASKAAIRQYLVHALLNNLFGSGQEALLSTLREAFRVRVESPNGPTYSGRYKSFSFDELLKVSLPSNKSLAMTDTALEGLLASRKGPGAFLVLTLLYPHLRYSEVQFHMDHLHPAAGFSPAAFKQFGLSADEQQWWLDVRDLVPNLQLLEGRRNQSKNDTPLDKWLKAMGDGERAEFVARNYLPSAVDYPFADFRHFYETRKELLRSRLRGVLTITTDAPPVLADIPAEADEDVDDEVVEMPGEQA